MLLRPDMVLIGATARRVGKTTFACELVRRHSIHTTVVAIKVTTVREHEGNCPHGGSGCGACTGFAGPYCITEETGGPPGKDTTRLFEAGAARVFWLRVRRNCLADGMAELLRRVPQGAAVVCESNSLRHVVEPGVFLVIRAEGETRVKPSCADVMHLADRVLCDDGRGWERPADAVTFTAGRWVLRQQATAIILAGGQSRRMGTDKSLLPMDGQPLIQHIARQLAPLFEKMLIGANNQEKYAFMNLPVVPDEEPDQGPLMGILSCLSASACDLNFVTACDIPHMDLGFILRLLKLADSHDIVMPISSAGCYEPLFAVYRKRVAPMARLVLHRGGRRITDLFESAKVRYVDLPESGWYRNLNTPDEYQRATERSAQPSPSGCGGIP